MLENQKREVNQHELVERVALEVSDRYSELLPKIEALPDLLELVIENYDLDNMNFTRYQAIDLGNAHKIIFNVLKTVQNALWDYLETAEGIDFREVARKCEHDQYIIKLESAMA